VVYFGGFFAKLGHFTGFSLFSINNVVRIREAAMGKRCKDQRSAMGGKGDITFSARFFLYIIRRKDQRSCDGQDGGLGTNVI
jgi:hypothetical protein